MISGRLWAGTGVGREGLWTGNVRPAASGFGMGRWAINKTQRTRRWQSDRWTNVLFRGHLACVVPEFGKLNGVCRETGGLSIALASKGCDQLWAGHFSYRHHDVWAASHQYGGSARPRL